MSKFKASINNNKRHHDITTLLIDVCNQINAVNLLYLHGFRRICYTDSRCNVSYYITIKVINVDDTFEEIVLLCIDTYTNERGSYTTSVTRICNNPAINNESCTFPTHGTTTSYMRDKIEPIFHNLYGEIYRYLNTGYVLQLGTYPKYNSRKINQYIGDNFKCLINGVGK